ncbi:MAG: hypothetical protein Q4F94_06915, partial [Dialister sp.]|nr:hypothetical protein [Dialister sp.]
PLLLFLEKFPYRVKFYTKLQFLAYSWTDAASTLQLAILFIWIAVSSIDAAEHLLQNPSVRTPQSGQAQ